jgi:hypothetical protein
METRKQKLLIKKIVDARNKILISTDREIVTELVNGVIETALPIPPAYSSRFDNRSFKDFSKVSALKLLSLELAEVQYAVNLDWEIIQFQIPASMYLLIMTFIDGGEGRIKEIIDETL